MATEDSALTAIKEELYASNMEAKILTILSDAYPNLDCGPGTPVYEMVVRPMALLWERQKEGVVGLIEAIDPTNYASMPAVDLDTLLARYFVTRRKGKYVTGVIRVYFKGAVNVNIPADEVWSTSDGRTYSVVSDHNVTYNELSGDETDGYYLDVAVKSTGTSATYNATMNETINVGASCTNIVNKAYFLIDTTDGGESESNYVFFNRAKEELAARNLYSYKSVRSTILDNFSNIKEVVPIGIRDDEFIRDLHTIPGYGTVHIGGKCDIYVRPYTFETKSGLAKPLCFPLSYKVGTKTYSLATDPQGLLEEWNTAAYTTNNKGVRGTSAEEINGVSDSSGITSLTYDLSALDNFIASDAQELLHTDNVVKTMWPIIVTVSIKVSGADATTTALIKRIIAAYINGLEGGDYPRVTEIVHLIRKSCSAIVHMPLSMHGYYLNETFGMESFGLNKDRNPSRTLLVPQEDDSLKFRIDKRSQISLRTCCWYTNTDLIQVEVSQS